MNIYINMINGIMKYTVQEEQKLKIIALDIVLMDCDKNKYCYFLLITNKYYIEINWILWLLHNVVWRIEDGIVKLSFALRADMRKAS